MTETEDSPARRLVTTYCFTPYADTAGVVAAKRVRDRGEPVDVIYNAMDSVRQVDPETVRIAGHLVRRSIAIGSETSFTGWSSIADFQRQGLEAALRWEGEQGPYDSLYSRAQFPASHFLAARIKMMRPDITWEAEFSDPLSRNVNGDQRSAPLAADATLALFRDAVTGAGFAPPRGLNMFEWCETVAYALADSVVFTNANQRDFMLEHCADRTLAAHVEQLAVVSPHPTLPPEFYSIEAADYPLDPAVRNIGYFGNFYANRGVSGVLRALGRMPQDLRDRLRLHVFTSQPDELRDEVRRARLAETVVVNDYVGYLAFLNLCTRLDCLLVNDAVSPEGAPNPFLPSKWSDYSGSGTPVWGIVEEGSPLDGQPLDHRSPIDHLTATIQVLAAIAAG